jgi:transposase-like protein
MVELYGMAVAAPELMSMDLTVLESGNCEELKLSVHATALGLAVVMGAYNVAAWMRRRQTHLAVNSVMYVALAAWEQQHVAHHMAEIRRCREAAAASGPRPVAALAPSDVAA